MDTDDTTEVDTDTPAADAGGVAVELALHLIPPAAWQGFFALLKIAEDPKAVRRVMRSLHDSLAAEAEAQKKTRDERAAHDAKVVKDRAELVDREKKLRAREVAHAGERGRWEDTQKMIREGSVPQRNSRHPDDDGWTPPAGSGMSRTFTAPRTTVRRGPGDSSDFPPDVTLTRNAE
jgi:hypothetical protein